MYVVFVVLFLVLVIAAIYYFVRTLLIMGNRHVGWAIAGFIVSPIAQIIFYIRQKQQLTTAERGFFKRYFASIVLYFVIGLAVAWFILPVLMVPSQV